MHHLHIMLRLPTHTLKSKAEVKKAKAAVENRMQRASRHSMGDNNLRITGFDDDSKTVANKAMKVIAAVKPVWLIMRRLTANPPSGMRSDTDIHDAAVDRHERDMHAKKQSAPGSISKSIKPQAHAWKGTEVCKKIRVWMKDTSARTEMENGQLGMEGGHHGQKNGTKRRRVRETLQNELAGSSSDEDGGGTGPRAPPGDRGRGASTGWRHQPRSLAAQWRQGSVSWLARSQAGEGVAPTARCRRSHSSSVQASTEVPPWPASVPS